jgi:hypothetical protein
MNDPGQGVAWRSRAVGVDPRRGQVPSRQPPATRRGTRSRGCNRVHAVAPRPRAPREARSPGAGRAVTCVRPPQAWLRTQLPEHVEGRAAVTHTDSVIAPLHRLSGLSKATRTDADFPDMGWHLRAEPADMDVTIVAEQPDRRQAPPRTCPWTERSHILRTGRVRPCGRARSLQSLRQPCRCNWKVLRAAQSSAADR